MRYVPFVLFIATTLQAADVKVVRHAALPRGEVRFVFNKTEQTMTDLDKAFPLKGEGPFRVEFKPKGGQWVMIHEKYQPGSDLKLFDYVGTVTVFGDDLPRVDRVVLTLEDDPGPGEKAHKSIQSAGDYRIDLVVPPGFYSVWIVPSNGAKAQRIADRIRVLAGRETRVPE